MRDEKYMKIVYQSEPIGENKIILYLTTFDTEAYEKEKNLKEIPQKIVAQTYSIDRGLSTQQDFLQYIEKQLNHKIDIFYKKEIEKMKIYIEKDSKKIVKGNITNSDNIVCDIIEGNVINCDNVKTKEIRGNTINCEIYKL